MPEVTIKFQPEDEVYGINRFSKKIYKSKVLEVRVVKYATLVNGKIPSSVTLVKYHTLDDKTIIFLEDDTIFATYEEAAQALHT